MYKGKYGKMMRFLNNNTKIQENMALRKALEVNNCQLRMLYSAKLSS